MSYFKSLIAVICLSISLTACAKATTDENPAVDSTGTASQDEKAVVYMTTDISPEALVRIYEAHGVEAHGRVAVKISTGESAQTNYLRPELIAQLVQRVNGTLVECNTAYGGSRSTTQRHRQAIAERGFNDIAAVDCDCDGHPSAPRMKDIGILASTDPVALDQACLDLVFNHENTSDDNAQPLQNRINQLHGTHTVNHAEQIGLGTRNYHIVSID